MISKDYYEILQVEPNANEAIIKKAYRTLAKVYHPDKNRGNAYFDQKFKEIAEAYRVLSNEKERTSYNYQRHNGHDAFKKPAYTPTVTTILTEVKKLRKMVAAEDPERMNTVGLYNEIERLVQVNTINLFIAHGSDAEQTAFIDHILFCSQFFQYTKVQSVILALLPLAGAQNEVYVKLKKFETRAKYQSAWNRYKLVLVLLVVMLLCLMIYFVG